MDNLKMLLNNGTELRLEAFGVPCHCVMLCEDKDVMTEVWDTLTEANLRRVYIQQGDVVIMAFNDCFLNGQQSVVNPDGSLTVHFYLDGTRDNLVSDDDREYIEAAKILLGEVE